MANRWFLFIALTVTCGPMGTAQVAVAGGKNIRIEFDGKMRSRVITLLDGGEHIIGAFTPSETIQVSNVDIADFSIVARRCVPAHGNF
jgi:hypothetical protein